MTDFFYRTEDIKPEEVLKYYVESKSDREVLEALKSRTPVILVGSRGVGKSFLLRVSQSELLQSIENTRNFPVYISFSKSSLIDTSDPDQFKHWMLARICSRIIRSLAKSGLITMSLSSLSILGGGQTTVLLKRTRIEDISEAYEESYRNPGQEIDIKGLPTIDDVRDAIEDLCDSLELDRISLFFDEAAHIFLPEQQRQFFTLFRDLRSHYITCNAAVYPGVTSYGDTFQPAHDATLLALDRDVMDDNYVVKMREIVEKQADSQTIEHISRRRGNFSILAYAASGNPRTLLKTLAKAPKLQGSYINELIREYYRNDVWRDHSLLGEVYDGHRVFIDWGRKFIEQDVLPSLKEKNEQYLPSGRSTCFFWLHRDTPEPVKHAINLMAYTGIVTQHATGIKGTRSEIGTRYSVHLGCLFSQESTPSSVALDIAKHLTPKRMSEYGSNYSGYSELLDSMPSVVEAPNLREVLKIQLQRSIDVLDITEWQRNKLREMSLNNVGDVLSATETKLQEAYYIGEVRARRMRNAAMAAVFEYLSG